MGEITGKNWPYAFCDKCDHLSPVSDIYEISRKCLSCQSIVEVGPGNNLVFFDEEEAKMRNLPYIKGKSNTTEGDF